ncbi:MAG: hypothetical protein HKN50_12270 [Gammaproteobacteria bacterium]|nr:hypothetical protein [Gammaproteobacteria bacterium]
MSEYELIEAFWSSQSAAATALVFYLSIVSGYLLVAYVAGHKLLRSQAAFINCLFVIFASFALWGTYLYFKAGTVYYQKLTDLGSAHALGVETSVPPHIVIAFILGVGILGCLKFMWDVRHPKMNR